MKPGTIFTHAHWLDSNNQPARCKVTKCTQGVIYYRVVYADGTMGKPAYFAAEQISRYVKSA